MIYLTRRIDFCAAHRYYKTEWSEAQNREVFGASANPHGHGHNYRLEVTVAGEVDPETGMVMHLGELDERIKQVVEQVDHRHLNLEVPEFARAMPTSENLAIWLWERIGARLNGRARLAHLRLWEDDLLYVDYTGGERLDGEAG